MDDFLRLLLIYGVLPVILGTGAYAMRSVFQRLTSLEQTVQKKVEEDQVRQLLVDKIEPLREDVQDLKDKIDRIYDFLMRK